MTYSDILKISLLVYIVLLQEYLQYLFLPFHIFPSDNFTFPLISPNICSIIFLQGDDNSMESILCINIPVQMISCTDTDGKITPLRFRFRDNSGELVTVQISHVLNSEQKINKFYASFTCEAEIYGMRKAFTLFYNYSTHDWHLKKISL